MSVTPASLLVVAPAGYSFTATTPSARARPISSGGSVSVRYSVINGEKSLPFGRAARMRLRYALAISVLVIGGLRFGITTARANWRALAGSTAAIAAPSRRCRCQSSGRVMRSVTAAAMPRLSLRRIHPSRSHVAVGMERSVSRIDADTAPTRFELISYWHLDAPTAAVWPELTRVEDWPLWWRYVRSVRLLQAGDERGIGAKHRLVWTNRLPYDIEIDVEVVESVRQRRLRARATGQLEGEGVWELFRIGDTTWLRYTWRVELTKPWMRAAAPWLGPLFHWNHNGVMRAGAAGLAERLAVPLLHAS